MAPGLALLLLVSCVTCVAADNSTRVVPTADVLNATSGPTQQIPGMVPSTGSDAKPDNTDPESPLATTTAAVIPVPTSNVTYGIPTINPLSNDTDSSNHTVSDNGTAPATTISPITGTSTPIIPATDDKTTAEIILESSPTWEIPTDESITTTVSPEEDQDETPIIAVMVALSSLLIIVFIIIVLYMLR
ncbi:hypothetical protein GDO81_019229 [Engystomops pustulosus]|uniref:Uncharacterized protein n=2 Tax=Engystomops pustulosus TaxID=76066 RepID=A0AAV6ZD94_ENGPU|nr:hypothetical protein GDO81_019229 [Engystomops pustulosus]